MPLKRNISSKRSFPLGCCFDLLATKYNIQYTSKAYKIQHGGWEDYFPIGKVTFRSHVKLWEGNTVQYRTNPNMALLQWESLKISVTFVLFDPPRSSNSMNPAKRHWTKKPKCCTPRSPAHQTQGNRGVEHPSVATRGVLSTSLTLTAGIVQTDPTSLGDEKPTQHVRRHQKNQLLLF